MRTRRALDLTAALCLAALAASQMARLPGVLGETLGDPVARFGAVTATVVLAPVLVVLSRSGGVPGRRGPGAVLALAAWGALVALALLGTLDLDVPRRRGVLLAGVAAVTVAACSHRLGALRSSVPSVCLLTATLATLVGVHRDDGAPLRTSLPPVDVTRTESLVVASDAPSLLLITLDTTRADALGCYGQGRPVTPRIDALAGSGVTFTAATAEAPHTHPSIASLLTGRFPIEHGSVSGRPELRWDVTTLSEHLRAQGYATAGFLDNPYLGTEFGLARGYEHLERRVDPDRVADWLGSVRERPYFLHVHFFQPHGPYDLRVDELAAIGGSTASREVRERVGEHIDARTIRAGEVPGRHGFDGPDIAWIHDLYLSETRAMDAAVGEILDLVRAASGLDRTIVALAADHGEEFDERGSLHHSHTLYEELVRVPLIISAPARTAFEGTRIDVPVGLVDVAPTLLDLAGLPRLPEAAGRSLAPLFVGESIPERLIVTQRYGHSGRRNLVAARRGTWKLHLRVPGGIPSPLVPAEVPLDAALFDLSNDPEERNDLAAERPEVVRRLLDGLRDWEAAAVSRIRASADAYAGPRRDGIPDHRPISPALRSELRGLGYGDGR